MKTNEFVRSTKVVEAPEDKVYNPTVTIGNKVYYAKDLPRVKLLNLIKGDYVLPDGTKIDRRTASNIQGLQTAYDSIARGERPGYTAAPVSTFEIEYGGEKYQIDPRDLSTAINLTTGQKHDVVDADAKALVNQAYLKSQGVDDTVDDALSSAEQELAQTRTNIANLEKQQADIKSQIAKQEPPKQEYIKSVRDLIALNPQIKNPNLIYPGQEINVGDGRTYTVQKGDNLTKISKMDHGPVVEPTSVATDTTIDKAPPAQSYSADIISAGGKLPPSELTSKFSHHPGTSGYGQGGGRRFGELWDWEQEDFINAIRTEPGDENFSKDDIKPGSDMYIHPNPNEIKPKLNDKRSGDNISASFAESSELDTIKKLSGIKR